MCKDEKISSKVKIRIMNIMNTSNDAKQNLIKAYLSMQ